MAMRTPAGWGAGLVDEDQLIGIEIELTSASHPMMLRITWALAGFAVEPGLPHLANVLVLPACTAFLYVRPCRSRNLQTLVIPTRTPHLASSRSTISASEMSFVPTSTRPRMKSAWALSQEPRGLP